MFASASLEAAGAPRVDAPSPRGAPSKRDASIVAGVEARTGVFGVAGEARAGDGGSAGVVSRVLSHDGGFADALLVVDFRSGVCDGEDGFRDELLGVDGRTVDGDASGELGRRKGDVRGLLKDSGDGLYGVGVVDFSVSSIQKTVKDLP